MLGAAADNGIGIAGVAPGARLLPLRTSDNILHQGVRVAEAIVYATDHGARVDLDEPGRRLVRRRRCAARSPTPTAAAW